MFLKTCKCGKSQKSFKFDIGPSFMNTCCEIKEAQTPPKAYYTERTKRDQLHLLDNPKKPNKKESKKGGKK